MAKRTLFVPICKRVRKVRKETIGFLMSVRVSVLTSAWHNSTPTGRIFKKSDLYFSKICGGNSSPLKSDKK